MTGGGGGGGRGGGGGDLLYSTHMKTNKLGLFLRQIRSMIQLY